MGDQELRELQRQTRIMAEKRAVDGFGGLMFVMLVGLGMWLSFAPATFPSLPWFVWAVIVVGVPAAFSIAYYRQMTRG
jgi:fatty acid desaturase